MTPTLPDIQKACIQALRDNPRKACGVMRVEAAHKQPEGRCCLCVISDTVRSMVPIQQEDSSMLPATDVIRASFPDLLSPLKATDAEASIQLKVPSGSDVSVRLASRSAATLNDSIQYEGDYNEAYKGLTHVDIAHILENNLLPVERQVWTMYLDYGDDLVRTPPYRLSPLQGSSNEYAVIPVTEG